MLENHFDLLPFIAEHHRQLIACALLVVAWLCLVYLRRRLHVREMKRHVAELRTSLRTWAGDHTEQWAKANCDMGAMLSILASVSRRKKAVQLLGEAVSVYYSALEVYTEVRFPRERIAVVERLERARIRICIIDPFGRQ